MQNHFINIKTCNKLLDLSVVWISRFISWFKSIPAVDHFIRAIDRFNDRLGTQFGAAITYFSLLSLIPILMVSFATVGFVLISNQDLLTDISKKIFNNISDPTLATTLKNSVNTAIQQRTTVGITGLLLALYSGLNWIGNLRAAILAQSQDVWERKTNDQERIWERYIGDFFSLIGLMLALVITLSLTSVAGSAQTIMINLLGLNIIEWLRPILTIITISISVMANYLLFLWIFWILPRYKPPRKPLLRGTLLAAIGFEIIKFIMTLTLPKLATSPSGAAFGSVLGLMAFFYFFARLTLFCAAWIATAKYTDSPQFLRKGYGTTHSEK